MYLHVGTYIASSKMTSALKGFSRLPGGIAVLVLYKFTCHTFGWCFGMNNSRSAMPHSLRKAFLYLYKNSPIIAAWQK